MLRTLIALLLAGLLSTTGAAAAPPRERLLMDFGWRFRLGDPPDAGTIFDYPEVRDLAKARPGDAAEEARLAAGRPDPVATHLGGKVSFVQPGFADSGWRPIDLPHDWVVEHPAIQPDHLHLFVSAPPSLAVSQMVFRLKGYTSRVLRQEFPHLLRLPSMWTTAYFASTAGNVSQETIRRYIDAQSKRA